MNRLQKHIQKFRDYDALQQRRQLDLTTAEMTEAFMDLVTTTRPGPFQIDEHNVEAIDQIAKWMVGDPEFKGDLHRGLLLQGPIGTGKTWTIHTFQILAQALPPEFRFKMIRTQAIAADYEKEGWEGIQQYLTGNKCFDDLGEEKQEVLNYGTRTNVLQEILSARYERLFTQGTITHGTTNYKLEHFHKIYGARVASRIKEIFNFITMGGPDRRK